MINKTDNMPVIPVNWQAPGAIQAFYTLRYGGNSSGPYASFNLAEHVGDDPGSVGKNRQLLRRLAALPEEPHWMEQVHGTKVVTAGSDDFQGDACFTDQPARVCVVMTADCLPLLICNQQGTRVAAVHAGWRGLLNGVIENTLQKFLNDELIVFLGPAIGPQRFEVGSEVMEKFMQVDKRAESAFVGLGGDKYLADLTELAKQRLSKRSGTKVFSEEFCTYEEEDRFFSYRRDGITGRMASLIWMSR